MSKKSHLEAQFELIVTYAGLPQPVAEHRYHPTRKWRFDFAWPDRLVAVEIEGGAWTGGRHTRGSGFVKDCDKYNAAALLGWRVLRYTTTHLNDVDAVVEQLRAILEIDPPNA